ncbi:hypothetical protein OIDMADRAFT_125689 [Oidiodendron maius Zn]|uniref:Gti1/Pac2 family protein n=1 Tax=Oidiodendron maius (strain Zn) TaxID=913774 RepID=A0A0C3DDF7_OIDMZ|nr:hypothetical protein OIDMADRAFT_125689 [Oidiodendron maius Zn]
MASTSSPLTPTYYGYIASTLDGLLLFEAYLSGDLKQVPRRPNDRERARLIRSGSVFIYEEHSSGIKRWTDGIPWSPSRTLEDFLVYRELERPLCHGEKRAAKRSKRSLGISNSVVLCGTSVSGAERSLVEPIVDSYGLIEGGLVKKTLSVTIGGVQHHLVSYYTVADILSDKLTTPSKDPRFKYLTPRPDLITKQNFYTKLAK